MRGTWLAQLLGQILPVRRLTLILVGLHHLDAEASTVSEEHRDLGDELRADCRILHAVALSQKEA